MNLRRRSGVSSWTPRRVLDAAVASEWRPDGAVEVLTDDYRLIRYPDWALDSALPAAPVTPAHSGRAARLGLPRRPGHPVALGTGRGGGHRRGDRAGAPVGQARGGLVGLVRD